MLTLFFDSKGVIHHEYEPEGQTVNAKFYIQVLDRLCKHIARMRPEMWRNRKSFLLHDNACPHTAAIVQQFLAKKGVAQLSDPPYLPDLSPPQLFHFPNIKIGAVRWPLCFDRRHSEICNHEIKSVPNFWLRVRYETARRLRQQVYLNVRTLFRINITYFLQFFSPFSQRCCRTYWTHLYSWTSMWNFIWNFLKFFQKLPLAYIFINFTNLSKFVKFVKIVFDTCLNVITLLMISICQKISI